MAVRMPFAALILVDTWLMVFIPVCFLQCWPYGTARGLRVRVLRPGIATVRSPGIQPILVRVEYCRSDKRPILNVDWRPVAWEDFDIVLQKELIRRPPNWPVYLEGDPDMEWRWAVKTIDRIRKNSGIARQSYHTETSQKRGGTLSIRLIKTPSSSLDSVVSPAREIFYYFHLIPANSSLFKDRIVLAALTD